MPSLQTGTSALSLLRAPPLVPRERPGYKAQLSDSFAATVVWGETSYEKISFPITILLKALGAASAVQDENAETISLIDMMPLRNDLISFLPPDAALSTPSSNSEPDCVS